jgi:hypothetical protein
VNKKTVLVICTGRNEKKNIMKNGIVIKKIEKNSNG